MTLERTEIAVLTLEDEEVRQFRNFLKNALAVGYTSKFDHPLISAMYEALREQSKP